jgi:GAF domain-containing protein
VDDALLRDLSRVEFAGRDLRDILADITAIAARGIPGAESTSITLVRGDQGYTAAHFGAMALAADELQYERGYGPCLDAGRGNLPLRVDDMRTEQRWPDYAARVVAETDVRSSLSVPLPYQNSSIGALNIYSSLPEAFGEESLAAALSVAESIAVAVANAEAHAQLGEQARNMRAAMESRAVIEQAKGILMAQRHCSADEAFDVLVRLSQETHRKLRDLAETLVAQVVEG